MKKEHTETTGLSVPVMPVIGEYDVPEFNMFNRDGRRLAENMRIPIPAWDDDKDDPMMPCGTYLEDVYAEARSICSREDAKAFRKAHPNIHLMDNFDYPGEKYLEEDEYFDLVAEHIRLYNWLYSFRTLRRDYPEDNVKAFEFIRNADPKVCDSLLKIVNFKMYENLRTEGKAAGEEAHMRKYLRLTKDDTDDWAGIVRDGRGFITGITEADAEQEAEALDIYRSDVIFDLEDRYYDMYFKFSEVPKIRLDRDGDYKPVLCVYYHSLIQCLFHTMDMFIFSEGESGEKRSEDDLRT